MKPSHNHKTSPSQRLGRKSWMKVGGVLLASCVLFFFTQHQPEGLQTVSNQTEASKLAQEEGKNCLVFFVTPYCYPCQLLQEDLVQHPEITALLNDHFVMYEVDGSQKYTGGKELAERYNIKSFPSQIITNAKGELLYEIPSTLSLNGWKDLLGLLEKNEGFAQHELDVLPPKRHEEEMGLIFRRARSWAECKEIVSYLESNWKEEIWINPAGGSKYEVVLGRYQQESEAKATKRFLKIWEGEKTKLVRLPSRPLKLNLKRLSLPSSQMEESEEWQTYSEANQL
ncbi:MAG: thioredoxin family protein [Bacteroidota bacterium]